MTERSVSRAAERLGRTQSAVSHSLSRLRGQLGDPLLIKAGVRMQPTAFALDLIEQTRPMLKGIQRVLSPRYVFEPAHSQRVFRVAAPDFMLTVFAASAVAAAERSAGRFRRMDRAARADFAGCRRRPDRRGDRARRTAPA